MFQNPFKGLKKGDYLIVGILLLLALGNWLLDPYKIAIKDYLTDWPPVVSYIVLAALINIIVSNIVLYFFDAQSEEWWIGRQPKSAWRMAYLETLEIKEKNNKWIEWAMSSWLVSLILSFIVVGMVIFISLLFTETMDLFIILFAVYCLSRALPNFKLLRWK